MVSEAGNKIWLYFAFNHFKVAISAKKHVFICEISDFHGSDYDDYTF